MLPVGRDAPVLVAGVEPPVGVSGDFGELLATAVTAFAYVATLNTPADRRILGHGPTVLKRCGVLSAPGVAVASRSSDGELVVRRGIG